MRALPGDGAGLRARRRRLEPDFRLLKVDTEAEPGLAARYEIRSIPTTMLFARGQPVAETAGAMNAAGIVAWVLAERPE